LEFELHREAVTSLKLAPESDAEDTEADIEAELSAEELPHVGTLPKLYAHLDAIFQHLSYHWLRLVSPSATQVRARWPLDPTWALLRQEFARLSAAPPLTPDALAVVRGARFRGRARLLRKMANGLLNSLEVEDTSVASASLTAIQVQVAKWEEAMRRRAEKEAERLAAWRVRLLAKLDVAGG
jgi:3-oxoacyl-ACP reductase-like protein